jgi:hypothetical protein
MPTLRRLLAAMVLGATMIAVPPSSVPAALATFTCDATHPNTEFRWPIKSLSDPDRRDVDFHAIRASVARLRSFERPDLRVLEDTPRIAPKERHTYRVRARVVSARLESDGDVILVVAVPGHLRRTIVFEFANPRCVTKRFRREQMGAARRAVLRNCGPLDSDLTALRGTMRVRGVGYWDRSSSEPGSAPNAFQLWPVLAIRGHCTQV